jgi:signal transduction histidine kinase
MGYQLIRGALTMSASQALFLSAPTGELEALSKIARALASPLELPDLLDAILQIIVHAVPHADNGVVMLWNQSAGVLRPAATFGYNFEILKEIGLRPGESITGKVFDLGHPLLLETRAQLADVMEDLTPLNREVWRRSMGSDRSPNSGVGVPISAGNERIGVLLLETLDHDEHFTKESLPFMQALSNLIALAIDRERRLARGALVGEIRRPDRLRSEGMATVSHELRILLATIKGYTTALQMDEVAWSEAKRQEFLRLIEEGCNDMEAMIRDILDSSLLEVDQIQLDHQPLHLPALARELAAEVECRSPSHRPIVDFPDEFPVAEGDPRRIKQVFRNILDNAVKYSPGGGLIVIHGEARAADVVVSVSDQGIGIPSENLIPLFEKFYRVKRAGAPYIAGTGIGLPIARAIIEAHGGRIWADSREGEGTTIFFSMPRPTLEHKDR